MSPTWWLLYAWVGLAARRPDLLLVQGGLMGSQIRPQRCGQVHPTMADTRCHRYRLHRGYCMAWTGPGSRNLTHWSPDG